MPRGPSHPSRSGNRPLYAIDFTAVACGKRISNTKRRVRWRFGFANPDALAAGETGTACRGEEHDVTFVWSVTSGKRLILADGQEVHYSNSRSAVIDFSWTMRGNHVLKVVAHATAPMSADPGFRQYDFFVDGRSFFSFPKVYRLGLTGGKTISPDRGGGNARLAESSGRRPNGTGSTTRSGSATIAQIEAPHNPDEEEAYLREAIKASLEDEANRHVKGEKPRGTSEKPKMSAEAADLLIDFMDDFGAQGNTLPPAPAPAGGNEWALAPVAAQPNNQWSVAPPAAAAQPDNSWAMSPAPQPAPAPVQQPSYDQFGGGAANRNSFAAAAPSNPFAPAPPAAAPVQNFSAPPPPPTATTAPDPFAAPAFAQAPPPPPPEAATSSAPSFAQPPPPAPVAADPFSSQPSAAPGPVSPTFQVAPAPPAPAPAANVLTMNSLTSDGLLQGGAAPSASGSMADQALQNLMGSIDSFGLTGSAAKAPAANNPFDSNNIMSNVTLGEIKSSKQVERKGIMNAPPPAQGAMVMANSQTGNWGVGGGAQYGGLGASVQQQQQQQAPQYSMSGGYPQQQPQMGFGQQPPMQQTMMGQQPPMQQSMMGQQPPMQQQGYGAPQYGQQQQTMQQNQWGAPSY